MKAYETTATVDKSGELHVQGLPFAPGTQVQVSIVSKTELTPQSPSEPANVPVQENVARLFAALDKARNTESVGPLNREELYDRKVLR